MLVVDIEFPKNGGEPYLIINGEDFALPWDWLDSIFMWVRKQYNIGDIEYCLGEITNGQLTNYTPMSPTQINAHVNEIADILQEFKDEDDADQCVDRFEDAVKRYHFKHKREAAQHAE